MKTITNPLHETLLMYLADNKIKVSAMTDTASDNLEVYGYCETNEPLLATGIIIPVKINPHEDVFNGWLSGINPDFGYCIRITEKDENGREIQTNRITGFDYRTIVIMDGNTDIKKMFPFFTP